MTVLLVAIGAAIGAPLRYVTDRYLQVRYGTAFPWGTLTVNVTGSLILGFVLGMPLSPTATALLGTGFCGALTTYSTFSWETLTLTRRGEQASALGYVLLSLLSGMGAATLGTLLARAL
ncbi:chromosome condensation protein CrcB [Actinoplanes sp. SE50]|uniref:fluoride efflux transporter CrcB n=1 Tax=unclassified Actinoplanes TaxID=2626549 RepID=UPI00023EC8B9|nr:MULTISPECIES: fluoride efflux transporter CrcB [unclassified Actinoplanes]AEV81482.1 CrcB-like protein [Actinoplanes sp. SE50/110]ATO79885.1 chromosome condensation protein CrcB [Actinoplanes sp. SE50]SLL97287.1 chromosome condensation protein CrcB [Actinoplanes sp. SE50/110]